MKTLILFTTGFPFGNQETFIESEIPFLLSAFEKVFIVTNSLGGEQTRTLPESIKIIRSPYYPSSKYKLLSLLRCSYSNLWHELAFIKKIPLPINLPVISAMFSTHAKALEINDWLCRFVNENKIAKDGLYLYSYWMNDTAAGIALYKSKNKEVKAFCRAHGWDVYFERHQPAYLPFRNFMMQRLDACFCISENGQQYLRKIQTEKTKGKILLSRLGTFNRENVVSDQSTENFVLISCSNVIPLKRIHLIIEALGQIETTKIKWVHFGAGDLMEEIKNKSAALLQKKANIKYELRGHVNNATLLGFYKTERVDLFISTSETEGLPVSMMEAMAFGVPVIATNVGGVSEIISNGENGFLLDKSVSAEEIAKCLIGYFDLLKEERLKLRSGAQKIWREKFNAEKNYTDFLLAINSL